MSKAYYNEFDPKAAAWLRELIKEGLIADGDVDERSIADVRSVDLESYTQCHFFAGIGGWSYALRLAGWPDDRPVWTGSCPCQPFSAAGKQKGTADERHLFPEFARLIAERKPSTVFGEQVASKLGRAWLAGVQTDLERMGYSTAGADLCAAGVGAPHVRQRLFWAAYASVHGRQRVQRSPEAQVQEDRSPKTLGAWDRPGDTFTDWRKLLAGTCVRRLDDGVPSTLVVRPAAVGYGNAIVPQVAAQFIIAAEQAREDVRC